MLIKQINYTDDNHANLHLFMKCIGMPISDEAAETEYAIEEQEYKDRYKVSLGQHAFYIKKAFLPKFWLILSKEDFKLIEELIEAEDDVKYLPIGYVGEYTFDESDPFYQTTGQDFDALEDRVSKLARTAAQSIQHIALLVNEDQRTVLDDTNKVKDFDGILTFNSELGKDFGLHLCFDKVAPVSDENDGLVIDRTKMTDEDKVMWFPKNHAAIDKALGHINELVRVFYASKVVTWNEYIAKYAEMSVDCSILKAFLDQNIEYITFGGKDDWRVNGVDTPNNKACFEILDQELEGIIKYLDAIPKTEGVDIYSIDIDTYTVFGRNDNNHVVTPIVQGHTEHLLKRYSRGFERLLSTRMGMSDNAHFFKA